MSKSYLIDMVTKAIRFVAAGPSETGIVPACGALASLIERASGMSPFFVGKPNPLMMRTALKHLGVHSDDAIMVGDRMETDIIAGVQSGLETILVLSGVTSHESIRNYPYQPTRVVDSVADILV